MANKLNIKLGIIYYKDELILHDKVNYIEYIQINDYNEIKYTKRPVLIVGWNIVKNKYTSVNILNKKINDNLYWCFSFNEKKNDYIDNINKFIYSDVLNVFNSFEYIIISPVFNNKIKNENDIIEYFKDCKLNNIYVSANKELAILCNNTIYKINLKELKFFKYNINIIVDFLKENYKNFYYDRKGRIEKMYLDYFNGIDNNIIKKYIPLYNKIILCK